ncbi:MAG: LysM peptidoglycan-binding domain-containing protein [Firmicutes bacterium]|nr:LysM peptidoglycan-binding domain-containing protein [Bacillota bacterium]
MQQKRKITRKVPFLLVLLLILLPGVLYAQSYQVKPGDSLYLISRRYNLPLSTLKASNNLTSDYIYPGQTLMIPARYTVRPGDTLYLIATRNSISLSALRTANNIWHNELWIGQTLYLPTAGGGSPSHSGGNVYTVRNYDTLYLIAQRNGTSVQAIKAANGLASNTIYPGQKLIIPGPGTGPSSPGGSGNNGSPGNNSGKFNLTSTEIEQLAKLVRAEAEGEPFTGQVAVAASVLNRLNDPRYPNSITEIIYQVDQGRYYQYSPVMDGRINLPATESARKAVQAALSGQDPSYGAIGFYNPRKTTNAWVRSQPITATIGQHVFFKN